MGCYPASHLGATEKEQKKAPAVELKANRVPTIIQWTELFCQE